jgi:hypothetical protein
MEDDPISIFLTEKYNELKSLNEESAKNFINEIYATINLSLEDIQIIYKKHKNS